MPEPPSPPRSGRRPPNRTVRLLVLVLALLVAASLGLFLLGLGQAGADAPNGRAAAGSPAATVEPLTVVTAKGRFPLKVEVVATPEGWQRGLMGRTALAADAGMLFDYGRPREVTMWMKNTPLSLDMVFVGADGRVVRVAERTEPYSEALIPSFQPVLAVLEVAAGTAARLGIAPGSRLEHPIFRRPPP